ncbi:10578_t:CDS:2, partial [Entrophospora sp. SA101]
MLNNNKQGRRKGEIWNYFTKGQKLNSSHYQANCIYCNSSVLSKDNKVAEPYTLTIREETPSPTRREYFPDTSVENALDSPEISPPRETVKDIERAIAGFKSYKLALETKRGVGSKSQQEETEYKIQELEMDSTKKDPEKTTDNANDNKTPVDDVIQKIVDLNLGSGANNSTQPPPVTQPTTSASGASAKIESL